MLQPLDISYDVVQLRYTFSSSLDDKAWRQPLPRLTLSVGAAPNVG